MSSKYSHLPYRRGVGVVLLNDANHVFVGRRIDSEAEGWQMPQGGIDDNEIPRNAALRELEEETGITSKHVTIIASTPDWLTYALPDTLIPTIWDEQYQGQMQQWFLMRFTGTDDSDINIHTDIPEFNAWKWIEPQQLPQIIVPFKQQLYRDILALFAPHF